MFVFLSDKHIRRSPETSGSLRENVIEESCTPVPSYKLFREGAEETIELVRTQLDRSGCENSARQDRQTRHSVRLQSEVQKQGHMTTGHSADT